ncbi:hypothetical protein BS50DRAFT_259275 [Corynespora cassiicola Philippines]|uniref:Transmembrane protein n=1 Tax=Corynespora cassiicola Philippines TaxID=1448308 RepID=A0A2T2N1S9_CORCC|nr:hypothetical protein BS50DRAFT_259275 [Corynespora cassiicola Philippines]
MIVHRQQLAFPQVCQALREPFCVFFFCLLPICLLATAASTLLLVSFLVVDRGLVTFIHGCITKFSSRSREVSSFSPILIATFNQQRATSVAARGLATTPNLRKSSQLSPPDEA